MSTITDTPSIEHLKVRIRLMVALLLAAVIGISVWSLVAERHQTVRNAEQQLASYARALAEHSESAFAESDRVLKDVLHDLPPPEHIRSLDQRDLFRELQRQVGNSPQIGSLFLVDADGEMFLDSVNFPPTKPSVADREYFRYYRTTPGADLSLSRPVMSRLVQRWRFNLMRPLNRPGLPFAGLLAVAFEVDYFTNFFTPESLGKNSRIALIRTDGAPLVFKPYQEGIYEHTFKDTVLFREKLLAAPSGTFHAAPGHNRLDKAPRIVSYRKLSRFPVVAVVSLDKDEMLRGWHNKAILQLSMTLGLCLSVLVLMRLLMRHLVQLQAAQTALQRGQEELRLKAAQIDAAHDGILMIDVEGRLQQVNNAVSRMTGYNPEELHGKRLVEIEPPEYAVRVESNIRMLREQGEATFESAFINKNGVTLPVEVSARIHEGDDSTFILAIVRDISERKRNERREQAKAGLLERLATGADLQELLVHIVRYVEQERETALCSVLLADEDGLHLYHGAGPSLPESYNRAVNGLRIAQGKGSCGTAAFLRQRIITENIDLDPFWIGFTPARDAGLKSCWSVPVISSSGDLLGTFAIYHRIPAAPGSHEIQLLETAAHLASIAIDRFKKEQQKKELESQLHHVQRIEAIGQLAGGIAHDFNNLLTPILVYAEMIQHKLPQGDPLSAKTRGIIAAAEKARDLTQQLLSFGRKQILTLKLLDLNEIIGSFHDILARTIRENITIYLQPSPEPVLVEADRGQIEQILLNLAVNAQDAIQGNGTIVMETGHIILDSEYARLHPGLRPGRYALLSFIDSGHGMDDGTLSHIFEPFFTTKQVGHGTGLGLATVYGIVKQHEGYITVSSRPGEGTTFNIYLPLSDQVAVVPVEHSVPAPFPDQPADGTVLVVEDNEMVRSLTVELLRQAGYRVLEAEHPSAALELARGRTVPLDLLVTDVMMPDMSGLELYEALHESLPGLRVLYISGYASETFAHKGVLEERVNFLQKPFTTERFLERVRRTLSDAVI